MGLQQYKYSLLIHPYSISEHTVKREEPAEDMDVS